MKAKTSLSILATAAALLTLSVPVLASQQTDSRIESSANETYVFKTYLKTDDIKIHAKDGAVILTGTVAESYHKSLAQETVAGLPGVTSVDNRLETKAPSSTANSDAWLRDKVKLTLSFHRSVSALATEVVVKDGVVTLRGIAESDAQKELTSEYTKDVEGVKNVVNEIIVSKSPQRSRTVGETIDDSSITAQVKMALLYHRSTSVLNTTVTTKLGVVTLDGKARNHTEKNLVTKLAGDVKGVKEVKNLMSVEP
ncbi:MAG: transport-associated protein [Geobacteraceae bacterium GWC2_53_11]|nr:MAG: transport-associated protein [Geobacteraceae bacterium GWC2_53_11]